MHGMKEQEQKEDGIIYLGNRSSKRRIMPQAIQRKIRHKAYPKVKLNIYLSKQQRLLN